MPSKTQSILIGGVVAAVLGAILSVLNIPYLSACLGCLLYIGAGLIAVWHYAETHALTIRGGTGAGMGALAGVVAGLVGVLIGFALQAAGLIPGYSAGIDQAIAQGQISGEQAETVRAFFDSPFFYFGVAVVTAIIGAALGAIGGAIGASVFKRGGDTPGGGSTGGGPGGPREPSGGRGPSGGPEARRSEPSGGFDSGSERREPGRYQPPREEPAREEEEATPVR